MCFIQLFGHAVTPVDALMYFWCRIYRNVMFARQVSDSFDMISMIVSDEDGPDQSHVQSSFLEYFLMVRMPIPASINMASVSVAR